MNKTELGGRRAVHAGAASHVFNKIKSFVRKNPVLTIAFVLAAVTSLIVPPDSAYLGYLDYRTLTCLFCTLSVICALKEIRFFYVCAERIIALAKNLRLAVVSLVCITFVGSMLIANDMALITFLPLGYIVLHCTGNEKYVAYTFILQNIAANLGGMLTPFGNPQNLYLYSYFSIPAAEFMKTMFPPFFLAVMLILLACLAVPEIPIAFSGEREKLPAARLAIYLTLFALSILVVFRGIPYWAGLIVITSALLILDRKALAEVDYGLLFTFVCFFVFSGNMSRIPAVSSVMEPLVGGNGVSSLLTSTMSCQFISNVPSAILLSKFAESWKPILYGVNIGGCGTIISSLASLITFRTYMSHKDEFGGSAGGYMKLFSILNFAFLLVLLALCLILVI
ncbi:MAG: SLC13 family permease [Eubacteriales bacterium]